MNHIPYFTEIEDRFQQRRGSILMLSTLDWALIETWHDAGIPLEAVLRGIDEAFDKYETRKLRTKGRLQKINGLAWAAQSVMQSAELSAEAAIGLAPRKESPESGFETEPVAAYLEANAQTIEASGIAGETATRLRELAADLRINPTQHLEDLDRTLTVLEEKMLAAILAATPEDDLVALREQAARELAPYRGKMQAVQIKQVQQQFLQKRLLEACNLPRLSLFYMPHS
ncbi:hypothetical protein [Granulicella tundricola]|uniref:Uncharacterized protein n=1 Tax=Granulicella tundricola (strain ATCC BAA-1859 / DSM 23138 / MP5ACTX9) TaxID=1198114 RepID=E8X2R3_GRATM|nr:hypothetical protein [Granulicella tundricola]ADW70360.1 hypothetical protein AciX9_3352 [Granulicella tundricola MP5ACTX9]